MESILGTSTVVQVAIICHDVEKTAQAYAEFFGVPTPPASWTDGYDKAQTTYRGEATPARAKLAFFKIGDSISLELIQPDEQPSTWREHLDTKGEGLHHIAFTLKDMPEAAARAEKLAALGMPTVQTGLYTGGAYTYVDASETLKLQLELLCSRPKD